MTELIVGALELGVGNPDRNAVASATQPVVDGGSEVLLEVIGGGAEGANPQLLL
jgi:hypothetical protein